MATKTKPFISRTAGDLMVPEVYTISQECSVREAAALMADRDVTGLPVVDADGRCVGVVSAVDFVRRWLLGELGGGQGRVRDVMTADPVTAGVQTLIAALSRMMIDAHIHRFIVTDGLGKPIGIVASTDVLAAVTYSRP